MSGPWLATRTTRVSTAIRVRTKGAPNSVADQNLGSAAVERGVARLLRVPRVGWSMGHRSMYDDPSVQVEEEEDEDLAKPSVVGLYEVRSSRDVVTQECRPALSVAAMQCR